MHYLDIADKSKFPFCATYKSGDKKQRESENKHEVIGVLGINAGFSGFQWE